MKRYSLTGRQSNRKHEQGDGLRILHYALGFPPYRSGGLTKFCIDLIKQQSADGHETELLWPGRMGLSGKKVSVKNKKPVPIDGDSCLVQSFEVCNPLPVPYDEGITKFQAFTKDAGAESYEGLLKEFCPDVIHIHTLMGLHKSFLETAKKRNIRCVFTAHDYFPICPAVTLFSQGQVCTVSKNCSQCGTCSRGALALWKIRALQSPVYRRLKDSLVVRGLRKHHRDRHLRGGTTDSGRQLSTTAADYRRLRNYYYSLLRYMDCIHYNSTLTKTVYEQHFQFSDTMVIPISHRDIQDNRGKREFPEDQLRLLYLGPEGAAKGFFLLQEALDRLWKLRQNFCLDIYFQPAKPSPYMRPHKRYASSELESVFAHADLLIIPSIWQETFGYGVLEALSYGVPVLISGNVGAKDILVPGAGIVIEDINAGKLYHVLSRINSRQLAGMNGVILKKQKILSMRETASDIERLCYTKCF